MSHIARELVEDTLTQPRYAVRKLRAQGFDWPVLVPAALLVVVLNSIAQFVLIISLPAEMAKVMPPMSVSPLPTAFVQLLLLSIVVFFVFHVGRKFGGTGSFRDTFAVIVLLSLVGVVWRVAIIVAFNTIMSMSFILLLGFLGWTLWAFSNMVAELHGFRSSLKVLGASILAFTIIGFALLVVLSVFLTALGVVPPPAN